MTNPPRVVVEDGYVGKMGKEQSRHRTYDTLREPYRAIRDAWEQCEHERIIREEREAFERRDREFREAWRRAVREASEFYCRRRGVR